MANPDRLSGPTMEVTITDGTMTSTWSIPKALLSHYSEFFRVACNGPFKEAHTNKITLPDCMPGVLQVFIQWMYFNNMPFAQECKDGVWNVFRVWALADRLVSKEFKNCVMRDIYDVHVVKGGSGDKFSAQEIEWIAENAGRACRLRTWFIDTLALHSMCAAYMQEVKNEVFGKLQPYPDLLKEVFLKMAGIGVEGQGSPEVKPVEDYLEA